jgi:hypothetical protein
MKKKDKKMVLNHISEIVELNKGAISSICKEYSHELGIKPKSLERALRRKRLTKTIKKKNRLLTDDEENTLVGVLEAFSLVHMPLTRTEFLNDVRNHYQFGENWTGDRWYSLFMKRHKEHLIFTNTKNLKSKKGMEFVHRKR